MEYSLLREELLGALIALAKTGNQNPKTENTDRVLIEGLMAYKVGHLEEKKELESAREEKYRISPNCRYCINPCGNTSEFDVKTWEEEAEVCRKQKWQMVEELTDMAQLLQQGWEMGKDMSEYIGIFYKVLEILSYEFEEKELLDVYQEQKVYAKRMREVLAVLS